MAKQVNKKKKKKLVPVAVIAAVLIIACIAAVVVNNRKDNGKSGQAGSQDRQEDARTSPSAGKENTKTDSGITYYADIEIKDYGKITAGLYEDVAPITVKNFVSLAKEGFYDGLTFHRIMEGFMMQGGDPEGTGMGGSGKTIIGEFANNGYDNKLSHTRGALSMARSTNYNSASSQFFIVHQDSLFLDGDYAVFGYVTEGIEIVDKICENAQPIDGDGLIASDAQPVITSITIRDAE